MGFEKETADAIVAGEITREYPHLPLGPEVKIDVEELTLDDCLVRLQAALTEAQKYIYLIRGIHP